MVYYRILQDFVFHVNTIRVPIMGRFTLGEICGSCILSDLEESVHISLCLIMIFAACGRVGEPAYSSWALSTWDYERACLTMKWSCVKTSSQKTINFFRDHKDPRMCFYSSSARYFILSYASKRREAHDNGFEFIFPYLANLASKTSIASKVTEYVKLFQSSSKDG